MKFSIFALPFVFLLDIFVMLNFLNWHRQSLYEYQERQMDIQVNYCIDAATQRMLEGTSDIRADWSDWKAISVDPEIAYDTYLELLVRNAGYYSSEATKKDCEAMFVPFFCVCAYDGYYMLLPQETEITVPKASKPSETITYKATEMVWTPKLPYSYVDPSTISADGRSYTLWGLNLNCKDAIKVVKSGTTMSAVKRSTECPLNHIDQRQQIANKVADSCITALYHTVRTDRVIYISANGNDNADIFGNNHIQGPTCITYMSPDNIEFNTYVLGFGGARIDENDFVACYDLADGSKWYTYSSLRDPARRPPYMNSGEVEDPDTHYGKAPTEILINQEAAARKGYYFDPYFMK